MRFFHLETPIFSMEEGTVTLIRLVAPVKSAYDAVASMMLMPIVNVDIAYGDGTLQRLFTRSRFVRLPHGSVTCIESGHKEGVALGTGYSLILFDSFVCFLHNWFP